MCNLCLRHRGKNLSDLAFQIEVIIHYGAVCLKHNQLQATDMYSKVGNAKSHDIIHC